MSEGLNRITLIGNCARDAETKTFQGGNQIMNFTLACNERYKDKAGQWVDKVEFVRCTLWGPRGEKLAPYLTKGTQVFVEGSLATRSFEKGGAKQFVTEVNVKDIKLLGGKRQSEQASFDGSDSGSERPRRAADKPHQPVHAETFDQEENDPIPF